MFPIWTLTTLEVPKNNKINTTLHFISNDMIDSIMIILLVELIEQFQKQPLVHDVLYNIKVWTQ